MHSSLSLTQLATLYENQLLVSYTESLVWFRFNSRKKNDFDLSNRCSWYYSSLNSFTTPYQLEFSSSVEGSSDAGVLPQLHNCWDKLCENWFLQFNITVIAKYEAGTLVIAIVAPRYTQFVARIDENFHSFYNVTVDNQFELLQFFRNEVVTVYDSHLFQKGAFTTLAGAQKKDLYCPSILHFILLELPVDRSTDSQYWLLFIRLITTNKTLRHCCWLIGRIIDEYACTEERCGLRIQSIRNWAQCAMDGQWHHITYLYCIILYNINTLRTTPTSKI